MNDMFEAIKGAAEGPGREMGKRLLGDAVAQGSVAAVRRGRRRRAALQAGATLVAVAAIATGAWLAPAWGDGRDVDPGSGTAWDGSMTGARIGDVAPVPDVYAWLQNGGGEPPLPFCTGPYVPIAETGLIIRDESVRDLGIAVATTLVDVPAAEEGKPIALTSDYFPSVGVVISWEGDRDLTVMGYSVLVFSDGVMRSAPYALAGSRVGGGEASDGDAFEARAFKPETGRTEVPVDLPVDAYNCPLHGPDGEPLPMIDYGDYPGYDFYAQFDGDYTLHTILQVSDEAGVPLATFVDAVEVGATPLRVEEPTAKWTALDDEHAQAVDALRARVDAEGVALSETSAGVGVRPASLTCEDAGAAWAVEGGKLRVVDAGMGGIAFPGAVSLTQLGDSIVIESKPGGRLDDTAWYYSVRYLVLRHETPSGAKTFALGVGVVLREDEPNAGVSESILHFDMPQVDGGCANAATRGEITPGVYEASLVMGNLPPSVEAVGVEGHGWVGEAWQYLGEVTITE